MNLKKLRFICLHILFWFVLTGLPPYLIHLVELIVGYDIVSPVILIYMCLLIGVFYLNAYYLYKHLLVYKRYSIYAITCIGISITVSVLYSYIERVINNSDNFAVDIIIYSFLSVIPILLGTAYRIVEDKTIEERRKKDEENENIRSELSFLRSQVSPHFMFNVLNTLVALIRQKSDKLEPIVMELSNLMRYMLYESDEEKVSLKTEIEYLKSYIDIQKLRFGDKVKITFEYIDLFPEKMIEPMLLIPLVENAFKHGVNIIHNPFIHISLHPENQELWLKVSNHYKETKQNKKNSGIGISNLERRLNLLYPNTHKLQVKKDNNCYEVALCIQFGKNNN